MDGLQAIWIDVYSPNRQLQLLDLLAENRAMKREKKTMMTMARTRRNRCVIGLKAVHLEESLAIVRHCFETSQSPFSMKRGSGLQLLKQKNYVAWLTA